MRRLTVVREGPNKGKFFWSCTGAKTGTKHVGSFKWCFDNTPTPAGIDLTVYQLGDDSA